MPDLDPSVLSPESVILITSLEYLSSQEVDLKTTVTTTTERIVSSSNGTWDNRIVHMKKNEIGPLPHTIYTN